MSKELKENWERIEGLRMARLKVLNGWLVWDDDSPSMAFVPDENYLWEPFE